MAVSSPSIGTPLFYGVFFVAVLVMIGIDMLSLKKNGPHKVSIKEALMWTLVWIAVSCGFGAWLYFELASNPLFGPIVAKQKTLEFFTGYVIEKALSVDNLFVFLMIFSFFKVPPQYQHRVLLYGIFGAIVLRAVMVFLGAYLVREFSWILYLFGAFLVYTGLHMFKPEPEEAPDLSQNKALKWISSHLRLADGFREEKFFVVEKGILYATPLFLVLIMVELSDVVFAVDSIPAIFAITTDPFIVLTSNIFAILGLRALYFLLADMADRFHLLRYGLAIVLTFIGVKMLIVKFYHIPVGASLSFVFLTIALSIVVSLLVTKKQA